MGYPVFAAENYFNGLQFPSHVVSANEEATGHEAILVGRGRRSPLNYWTTTTPNQQATLTVDCGVAKTASLAVIDRVHNLAGLAGLKLRGSDDPTFTTFADLCEPVIPTILTVGADLNGINGALMEDGAWAIAFTPGTYRYFRWVIPALGAGVRPFIGNAVLCDAYRPGVYLDRPYGEGDDELMGTEETVTSGWAGTTRLSSRRTLEFNLRLPDPDDALARRHFQQAYQRGRPMWCFWDEAAAERSWVAKARVGSRAGTRQRPGWHPRQISLVAVEHEHLTAVS